MFGLMVIGVAFIYFILWMGAVVGAYYWAERRGYSKSKTIGVAFAAFLVMYLIPFWDLIPTLAAHKYYCEKEAGFWVYKTPEQWMKENPGVAETLVASPSKSEKVEGGWQRYWSNQRIYWDVRRVEVFHAIRRTDKILRDVSTGETLARSTTFWRGVSGNVFGLGGSPDELRQALILGWGDRGCGINGRSFDDHFNLIIRNYFKLGEHK